MTTPETPDVSSSTGSSASGRVKWFNNKAGYGFITVSSGEQDGADVFVHHSAIEVGQEQYRYLIQGEYVEFTLCNVKGDTHKWQAGAVKGINNGKLMCETRLETRETRETRSTNTPSGDQDTRRPARNTTRDDNTPHYRVRTRAPGPREGEEFILVRARAPRQRQQTTSPSKDVLRERRQPKAPFRDGDSN